MKVLIALKHLSFVMILGIIGGAVLDNGFLAGFFGIVLGVYLLTSIFTDESKY